MTACAATGAKTDLQYVSPKSGRAVSAAAAEPYKGRLLALPQFLLGKVPDGVTAAEVAAGLALTGHFLLQRVLRPRDQAMPEARMRLLSYLRPNVQLSMILHSAAKERKSVPLPKSWRDRPAPSSPASA